MNENKSEVSVIWCQSFNTSGYTVHSNEAQI